jgi:hypothetical protein
MTFRQSTSSWAKIPLMFSFYNKIKEQEGYGKISDFAL